MPGVVVLGELEAGEVGSATDELLAAGRLLSSELGQELAVVLVGQGIGGLAPHLTSRGADKVYLVEDTQLAEPQVDAQVAAFEQACRQIEPAAVLVAKTPAGSEIGPRLAFRLGVGVAQDCLELSVSPSTARVVATRPVYGGNAMAVVTFPETDPQVVVVRPKVYEPPEPDASRDGEVVSLSVDLGPGVVRTRLVETVVRESGGVRLEDATVVVSGGRGLGGPEPFDLLQELARLLGGAVGASRAVCDAGWLDHSYQVGLTGKTISPNLYITVGISGASQHMAGCSGAKHIVAINRDADANIFKAAGFGVVGDWSKVLPSFVETVRELVKS